MKATWMALLAATALAACAPVATKVESGDRTIERMVVSLDGAWNEITVPEGNTAMRSALDIGPAHVWTMEGLPVDRLLIYAGLKDGQPVHGEGAANAKRFEFRSTMQADEIVAMFEGMLTRDGSSFKLVKEEPAIFGGSKGVRFEYALVRKADNVTLSGLGYAAVNGGELFAVLYSAPRLGFFPRYQPRVEKIARSATVLRGGVTKP